MTDATPSPASPDRPPPRPLTGGVVMSAASRILLAATGAATTIFVARLLGPDGAGGFTLALTLITMLTVLTTFGVEHGVAYYVSSGRWGPRSAYATTQVVALVSGVAGAGLGLLARALLPSAFGDLSFGTTAVLLAALPFSLSWFYATYLALATDRYEAYVLPPVLQSTFTLVAVGVLGATSGLSGAVVGIALSHVVTALVVGAASRRALRGEEGNERQWQPRKLRGAVAFGVKGYAANALQFLNYRIDVFILAGVASASEVGYYSVAIAVTSVLWLLPRALSDMLFPRIATLSSRDDAGARAFVEAKSLRHTVAITVLSTVVILVAAIVLIVPVYGSDFEPAIDLSLILLPGVAAIAVSATLSATFVGRGHPGYSLAIGLITTPVTILLYALLIPPYEATGAALASSVSYALTFLLAAAFYRRLVDEPLLPRLVPTRSELADYRALAPQIVAWARGLRDRPTAP